MFAKDIKHRIDEQTEVLSECHRVLKDDAVLAFSFHHSREEGWAAIYEAVTVAGLELAMDILRRRRNPNKQIFMITDGKPTCLKIGKQYYKNSFGVDRKILTRCMSLATQCKKAKIVITTFMIASDPYLQQFVQEFTETNNGKAFFASLDKLGAFIFKDFESGKRKTVY